MLPSTVLVKISLLGPHLKKKKKKKLSIKLSKEINFFQKLTKVAKISEKLPKYGLLTVPYGER